MATKVVPFDPLVFNGFQKVRSSEDISFFRKALVWQPGEKVFAHTADTIYGIVNTIVIDAGGDVWSHRGNISLRFFGYKNRNAQYRQRWEKEYAQKATEL
jgi:hypothetical protein